jgi:hypothetical protein
MIMMLGTARLITSFPTGLVVILRNLLFPACAAASIFYSIDFLAINVQGDSRAKEAQDAFAFTLG